MLASINGHIGRRRPEGRIWSGIKYISTCLSSSRCHVKWACHCTAASSSAYGGEQPDADADDGHVWGTKLALRDACMVRDLDWPGQQRWVVVHLKSQTDLTIIFPFNNCFVVVDKQWVLSHMPDQIALSRRYDSLVFVLFYDVYA